jgi:hypothetical protein
MGISGIRKFAIRALWLLLLTPYWPAAAQHVGSVRLPIAGATAAVPLSLLDQGIAPDSTPITRLQIVLKRSASQESALQKLLADQQNPTSPSFHKWLTPVEFGRSFGPSDSDLLNLTGWLQSQGFSAIRVNPGRTAVEVSGTAASFRHAFHASVHQISVSGRAAYAAVGTASVPVEIASLITGFAPLPSASSTLQNSSTPILRRDSTTGSFSAITSTLHPETTIPSNGTVYYGISPYDFAAMYDVLPLWNASTPIDGTGQTIAIVGDTDINPADFVAFRKVFNLPLAPSDTSTSTKYLNIIYNGNNPGIRGDEFHADSDTQWAAAAAKGAIIDYIASQATEASSGVILSAEYAIDNNLASILVDSYYTCEADLGAAGNALYSNLWQQAAAQGITVITPTGDSGAAACDAAHVAPASSGVAVNGIASTPYTVAVGGTEFYTPNGQAQYFGSTNPTTQSSVTGYIPELVWNDSCTDPTVLAEPQFAGLSAEQACNSTAAKSGDYAVTIGGGGGPSVTYTKPSWQSAGGVPADGFRDLPDVSLFASQGRTNSFYLVCQQDRDPAGAACNVNYPYSDFAAYGGTEVAAPAFAGILALAAQQTGGRIGNPNPTLYALASKQFASATDCNATGSPASSCIFHDITMGTNAMPCVTGTLNCVTTNPADTIGILSAPGAAPGYDTSSGLGSVDAYNLVKAWGTVAHTSALAILSVSPSSIVHGSPVTATVSVSGSAGIPTGDVSISAQASNGAVGFGSLVNGTFTQSFSSFPGGTYGVQAHYAGDSTYAATDSNFVSLTVTPEPSTTTVTPLNFNPVTGTGAPASTGPYGTVWYIRVDVAGQSGQGTPTGDVTFLDNGSQFGAGVARLNSSGYAEGQNNALTPGTHVFTSSYLGDPSFNPSSSPSATLTVTQASTVATVSSSASTVAIGGTITLKALVATTSFGYLAPSGTITFYAGSTPLGTSTVVGSTNPTTYQQQGAATLTVAVPPLPIGTNAITAQYSGDTNYLASVSSPITLQITNSTLTPTSTYVFPTPYTVNPGSSILYTAIITPSSPSPTGTVQFVVDGQDVGTPQTVVPGGFSALQTTVAGLAIGPHTLTCVYSGDTTNYQSSNSQVATFFVVQSGVASTITFTAQPTTFVKGTTVSVPVTVTSAAPVAGQPTPTGTIQFVLDGSLYGTTYPLANAAATLSLDTSNLQVGTHSLSVFYSGDTTFRAIYGYPVTLTVQPPGVTASSIALSNVPTIVFIGSSPSFTATVSPNSPTPTGVLEIIIDDGIPGPPILLTGATTTLNLPGTVPVGQHTVKVFYSGDNNYDSAASVDSTFTVVIPQFTITPATSTATVYNLSATASVVLTITPINYFDFPVTFSCSGLPANTTCAFAPAQVTPNGHDPVNATLTFGLDTGVPGTVSQLKPVSTTALTAFAGIICLGLPFALRRRTTLRSLMTLLGLAILAAAVNGCGSGYVNQAGMTPLGSYTVTVTATSAVATDTATINLTVQP